jgi:hypothetical protein
MKIRPVGAELFHAGGRADGRTDRHDKANSSFSQFWESAPPPRKLRFFPTGYINSRFCAFRTILRVNSINCLVCD